MCANSPAKPKMIATAAPESVAWLHCGGRHTLFSSSLHTNSLCPGALLHF